MEPILEVRDLRVYFHSEDGAAKAVDGVSLEIYPGETLGVVGESGCGKSVTAFSILRLIPTPHGEIAGGEVRFRGKNLLELSEAEMRRIRGNDISMVFQEPMTSLNPILTVGAQITEAIRLHQKKPPKEARQMAIQMLKRVGIPSPEIRIDEYPHQLSGGMKQRVMIAMALVCRPAILIADEPTTALDVTIQAQILNLLRDLQKEMGMAIMLITHDLGVIAEMADRVAVMYAGKVVEYAPVIELFERPRHPYTVGLFESLPQLDAEAEKLNVIPGAVPNPLEFPTGCRFRPRCWMARPACEQEPPLRSVTAGHFSACHFAEELEGRRA